MISPATESQPSLRDSAVRRIYNQLLGIDAAETVPEGWLERPDGCLWPAPFDQDTFESAFAFVREQWTWNEAAKATQQAPDLPYIEAYAWEWHEAKRQGRMLITEKCRRMWISWEARALELHQMGLSRSDQLLGGDDLEAAAKHVWRLKSLYEELMHRHPEWRLPGYSQGLYDGEKKLKRFGLANGSVCNYVNGQQESIRGDGVSIITLEEASSYRNLSGMVAQAKIICQNSAGEVGGFVNLIANCRGDNEGWQKVKTGGRKAS